MPPREAIAACAACAASAAAAASSEMPLHLHTVIGQSPFAHVMEHQSSVVRSSRLTQFALAELGVFVQSASVP